MEQISYKAIEKACNDIYQQNQNNRLRSNGIDDAYKNGMLISYINKRARVNLSMYQLLQEEFEKNFRLIIENEYPDFDIDMWNIKRELETKKDNKK